jgi:hypothetical protein
LPVRQEITDINPDPESILKCLFLHSASSEKLKWVVQKLSFQIGRPLPYGNCCTHCTFVNVHCFNGVVYFKLCVILIYQKLIDCANNPPQLMLKCCTKLHTFEAVNFFLTNSQSAIKAETFQQELTEHPSIPVNKEKVKVSFTLYC